MNIREIATTLAAYACDNRRVNDPVYRMVTENRDPGPVYSSCGDLAHWLLFTLGCRAAFINRQEHQGYVMGRNVSRLSNAAEAVDPDKAVREAVAKASREAPLTKATRRSLTATLTREQYAALDLQPGDILIKWQTGPDAHVMVFDRIEGDTIHTYDYGKGALSREAWRKAPNQIEGARRQRSLVGFGLKRVLRLDAVEFTAEPNTELIAAAFEWEGTEPV